MHHRRQLRDDRRQALALLRPGRELDVLRQRRHVQHLDSDFYFTKLNQSGLIEDLISRDPPDGPLPGVKKGVRGYVAVALCESSPTQEGSNGPVSVAAACPALAAWDLHDNLDSNGAILFRRFVSNLLGNFQFLPNGVSSGFYTGSNVIWDQQFSAADPVNTPSGLNTENSLVGQALADAVTDLEGAGIPLDAPLRGYQFETRGGKQIPIHGGPGSLGVFNAINVGWRADSGYPDVRHGSSFIAAMAFRNHGCPARARTFVTYGQTENQDSPHARDYTRAFSKKRWNKVPFCAGEIRRDPRLQTEHISAGG